MGKVIIRLLITIGFGLSTILVDKGVMSCSSKAAVPSRPQPIIVLKSASTTEKSEGVWKTEGDRSSHSQQEEQSKPSIVNGHNDEGLGLKPLPTREDTGISDRQGGSESDDDETAVASSSALLTLSDTYNNNNNKPLALVQFSNKSIQCNDKTTAGYYTRKSPLRNVNIWIVFLEGGWYCFDERSCQNRWLRMKDLMSSSSWPHYKHVGGILSSDPGENPYWWSANHVFVPYCSSDAWSGTAKAGVNSSPFSFMGALIIDEVIKNLIRHEGLRSDSTIILAGSSAGGTGVMINLDQIVNLLAKEFGHSQPGLSRVKGIADSGWFIDKLPSYLDKKECHDVAICSPEISLKKGMSLWNSRLPKNCQDSYPDKPWSCFFGYKIYPTLKASLFVFQWLFDEAQMLANNVPVPALKKEEWDYIYRLGDELKKTLINVTNVFIPSCMAHTVLTHRDWRRVEVNSVYLPRALKCWEAGGIMEESNFIPSSRASHRFREDEESSLTNLANRKFSRTNRKISSSIHPTAAMEQSDFPEVVSSNDSSRRNRRRHNRHRHNRPNTHNNSKREQRRKRRKKSEQERLLESQTSKMGDPSVNRQRKRHNDEQFSIVGESFSRRKGLGPKSSIIRRNPSKVNSDSNGYSSISSSFISSNRVKPRNKKKNRNRRWFSFCDAGLPGIGENGINTDDNIRLIEKCSWPQCNKSCPKLLDPLTGDEVDFKDLLRSFGLDMGTMAKALGIDLATLNSMDHHVLLQMLTQHA